MTIHQVIFFKYLSIDLKINSLWVSLWLSLLSVIDDNLHFFFHFDLYVFAKVKSSMGCAMTHCVVFKPKIYLFYYFYTSEDIVDGRVWEDSVWDWGTLSGDFFFSRVRLSKLALTIVQKQAALLL